MRAWVSWLRLTAERRLLIAQGVSPDRLLIPLRPMVPAFLRGVALLLALAIIAIPFLTVALLVEALA